MSYEQPEQDPSAPDRHSRPSQPLGVDIAQRDRQPVEQKGRVLRGGGADSFIRDELDGDTLHGQVDGVEGRSHHRGHVTEPLPAQRLAPL